MALCTMHKQNVHILVVAFVCIMLTSSGADGYMPSQTVKVNIQTSLQIYFEFKLWSILMFAPGSIYIGSFVARDCEPYGQELRWCRRFVHWTYASERDAISFIIDGTCNKRPRGRTIGLWLNSERWKNWPSKHARPGVFRTLFSIWWVSKNWKIYWEYILTLSYWWK